MRLTHERGSTRRPTLVNDANQLVANFLDVLDPRVALLGARRTQLRRRHVAAIHVRQIRRRRTPISTQGGGKVVRSCRW